LPQILFHSKLIEFLNCFAWKPWKKKQTINIEEAKKETEKIVVKTSIRVLENLLKNIIVKNPERCKDHSLLLAKINANEVNYIQNLIDKDGFSSEEITDSDIINKQVWLLHSLKRNILKHTAFYIWDKELQQYATGIDYFEIINHDGPAVGGNKDYLFYKGEEIESYGTVVY
jgi:hypothetical protein